MQNEEDETNEIKNQVPVQKALKFSARLNNVTIRDNFIP